MSRPDRQVFVDRVERKVGELEGSGLSATHLRWGALVTLDQGLSLRDAVVLREARRRKAMETDRARDAWDAAIDRCRTVLSEPTMAQFIEPVELVGEDNGLLVLTCPTGLRAFLERRYSALLNEAVRLTEEFAGVRFASVNLPIPLREVYAR